MNYSNFENLINYLKEKTPLIITHNLVDVDALTSSLSFKFLLNQIWNDKQVYLLFSEFKKSAKEFLTQFTNRFHNFIIDINVSPDIDEIDLVIVIDSNNLDQVIIPNFGKRRIPILFIDHHMRMEDFHNQNVSDLSIIDENFNSTSEIVYELFKHQKIHLPTPYIYLIIAGIISDTGLFRNANKDSIKRVASMFTNEVDYQEILSLLDYDKDISEKIARIKGIQRVQLLRIKDYLIGITHVSNFGAVVASKLLNLGFDISLVQTKMKHGFKITTRAKNYICLTKGLHLGNILNQISQGKGGGHAGAASVRVDNDIDIILQEIIEMIKKTLIKEFPYIKKNNNPSRLCP
jgi:nanoRNase/pAp phosphatase (c-di-AMP/oligoRNAs hydrolase)